MKKLFFSLVALCLSFTTFAQLPNITLKDINGKTVNVAELSNDGKPIIIDFFATWCKPCAREIAAIHEVYPDWQEETGVKVILVSIDEAQDVNKVKPMVDGQGWEFETLLDPNSDLKRALGIQMIPYTMVIDGEGKIVYRHSGYADGVEEELIEKARELVNK